MTGDTHPRFAKVLLLDEPTNDLDIDSLDVLEEGLLDFPGALVLVTHDRYLLDHVCDKILGFDGRGGVHYYGDYKQYLNAIKELEEQEARSKPGNIKKQPAKEKKKKVTRLSYLDQREYDMMEGKILEAEEEESALQKIMESPETSADTEMLHDCWQKLESVQKKVSSLYERWEELEEKKKGL